MNFGNSVTYNLHEDDDEQKSECIMIMVDKENKIVKDIGLNNMIRVSYVMEL